MAVVLRTVKGRDRAPSDGAKKIQRYTPPKVDDREAALRGRLARPRAPWRFALGGVALEARHDVDARVGEGLRLKAICEDGAIAIDADRALIELVLAELGERLTLEELDGELAAIFLEAALERALPPVEAALGRRIRFTGVDRPTSNREGPTVGFRLAATDPAPREGEAPPTFVAGDATVMAPIAFLERIAAAYDQQPEIEGGALAAPLAAAFRFGGARIGARELQSLRVGDVIVLEAAANQLTAPIVVLAERLIALAQIDEGQARVASNFVRPSSFREKMVLMSDSDDTPPLSDGPDGPIAIDGIEDAPVKLVFELGRSQCVVGDLKKLGPGFVFPLTKPVGEEVDILAGGARIGEGQIVRLNDAIGVRILRLVGKDEG